MTRGLDMPAICVATGVVILPSGVEADALLGRDDGVQLLPRGCLDRIERGLDWLENGFEPAVPIVEHGIHGRSLRRREIQVLVERLASRGNRRVVFPKDAIGRESDDASDEKCAEQEGDGLLFRSLHGQA